MKRFLPDVWLAGAWRVWQRNLTVYRKTYKMNILPNFFEPVVYLLAMGVGLGGYIRGNIEGMSYLAFITPGLIVASAMNGASFETTYNVFVKMHFSRTYNAITATPVNIQDAMIGEALWGMTRALLYGVAFAIVVGLFGLLPGASGLLIFPVILLTAYIFAAIGLCFTAFIKVIDLYSFYYTLFVTPMFLFSGVFFPLDRMPAWVRGVAWVFPLSHCVNLAKAAIHGGSGPGQVVLECVWILAVGSACLALAVTRVRRSFSV